MAVASEVVDQFSDPLWRLKSLYWIIDKDGQRTLFSPNRAQKQLLSNLHGRDAILKARQLGMTTLMCLIALDECLFNPDWNAAIIAHRLEDAKKIFETKVKYPYDNLPPAIRSRIGTTKDSADTLHFENNSSISVTTSARSGTLQRLHVSEFGKICSEYPNKAREIKTGSFPAAERGQITVESTAEGQEGDYFDIVQRSRRREPRSAKDWKFHFFPWHDDPGYVACPSETVISPQDEEYFSKLEGVGITLTDEQKAWYVQMEEELGADMKREYPSTPDEAFEQAIEGAYFEKQLAWSRKNGRVGSFPIDPRYPVNTFWDLGRNDYNTIWLHQHISGRNRFVGYYENSGEWLAHYVQWLKEWADERGTRFDRHYWPHDGRRQDLFLPEGRLAVAEDLGISPQIVDRPTNKALSIESARNIFPTCDFDEDGCKLGLSRLAAYRKDWDSQRGVFKDQPRHDVNSHGADGFQTFACGFVSPSVEDDMDEDERSHGRSAIGGY